MELVVFARFHARDGCRLAVAGAIRDERLFYIHSRWVDEAAFDLHAEMPHTVCFLACVQPLIDHPLDVTRSRSVDWSQL